MAEAASMPAKTIAKSGESGDQQALAHVEKWLAVIREIGGDRRSA